MGRESRYDCSALASSNGERAAPNRACPPVDRMRLLMTKPCAILKCERPLWAWVAIEDLQSIYMRSQYFLAFTEMSTPFSRPLMPWPFFIAEITYPNEPDRKMLIAVCSNLEDAGRELLIGYVGFFFQRTRRSQLMKPQGRGRSGLLCNSLDSDKIWANQPKN